MAAIPVPAAWRRRSRSAAGPLASAAGFLTGLALRLVPSLPGLGGAAAVTAGSAVIVHDVFRQVPVLGVAAVVAGAFGLLRDRRTP